MASTLLALVVVDLTQRSVLEHVLQREGFDVTSHGEAASFRAAARVAPPDAVLLDLRLVEPGEGSLVEWIRRFQEGTPLVLLEDRRDGGGSRVPDTTRPSTVLAPLEPGPQLLFSVRSVLESSRLAYRVRSLERENGGRPWGGVFGRSAAMRTLEDRLDRVARSESTVWLHGEAGVGKGLVARTLHSLSGRRRGPFVSVDCQDLRGDPAFARPQGEDGPWAAEPGSGPGEAAAGGTLLLRRLPAMALSEQAALGEMLRDRRSNEAGGAASTAAAFRLIVAHRWPLSRLPGEGGLGDDLRREVRGVEIRIPPLRERAEDIPLLVDHFLRALAPDRIPIAVDREATDRLLAYPWPGNVRELRDAVRRALLTCGDEVRVEDLPGPVRRGREGADPAPGGSGGVGPPPATFDLQSVERWAIRRALASCDGNVTEAAARLGIGRTTLYRKLDAYGLR